MKKYFDSVRQLKDHFTPKAIFDAFLGALVFSAIVMIPIYIILIQLMIVYMYKVRVFTILLIVATLFYNVLYHRLLKKALVLKNSESRTILNRIFNPLMVAMSAILLIIGLIILFVMVPIWLV